MRCRDATTISCSTPRRVACADFRLSSWLSADQVYTVLRGAREPASERWWNNAQAVAIDVLSQAL